MRNTRHRLVALRAAHLPSLVALRATDSGPCSTGEKIGHLLPRSLLVVTNQPFIVWTAGCRSLLLQKGLGERTWPLRLEVVGPGEQGGASSFRSFLFIRNIVHAFNFRGLDFFVLFHHVSGF